MFTDNSPATVGVRIAIDPTLIDYNAGHQAQRGDPEASLRAELMAELSSASSNIEQALGDMRRAGADASVIAQGTGQLQLLTAMMRSVGTASPTALAAFREQVASVVAQSSASVAAARDAAVASISSAELARVSAETRRQVEDLSHDMYERRIFDPYLSFTSPEDEAEYRRREEEAKRYIDAELAKGTPEGDLNAAGATQGQILDAAAHGADQSPEFKERWEALEKTAREQREAVRAAGGSTEEYDKRIEDSVRRFLRFKGLTEEQIDQAIAATNGDPLQAVKPYLENDKDALAIERDTRAAGPIKESSQTETAAAADDVFAKFQASGITLSDPAGHGCEPDHGLAAAACVTERTVGASR